MCSVPGPWSQAGQGPRGQVFTDSLWRVCTEGDRVNCASKVIGHSCKGCQTHQVKADRGEAWRGASMLIEPWGLGEGEPRLGDSVDESRQRAQGSMYVVPGQPGAFMEAMGYLGLEFKRGVCLA